MHCPDTDKPCTSSPVCATACGEKMDAIRDATKHAAAARTGAQTEQTVPISALESLASDMMSAAIDCYSDGAYEQGKRCAESLRDLIARYRLAHDIATNKGGVHGCSP